MKKYPQRLARWVLAGWLAAVTAHADAPSPEAGLSLGTIGDSFSFELPPGAGNVVPSLGLQTQHHLVRSEVGTGVGLTGLSQIVRKNASGGSIFHSSSGERLELDGELLIDRGDGYYRLEHDDGRVLQFVGPQDARDAVGANAWYVYQSGWTYQYGGTDNRATLLGATTGSALCPTTAPDNNYRCNTGAWYLRRVTAPGGQSINYTYDATSGYLTRIAYGRVLVTLIYAARTDGYTDYSLGAARTIATRLSRVETTVDGNLAAQYELQYADETTTNCSGRAWTDASGQSRLYRVYRVSTDDFTHKKLERCYERAQNTATFRAEIEVGEWAAPLVSTPLYRPDGYQPFTADLNRDGRSDVIVLAWGQADRDHYGRSALHAAAITSGDDADWLSGAWEAMLRERLTYDFFIEERGFVLADWDGDSTPELLYEKDNGQVGLVVWDWETLAFRETLTPVDFTGCHLRHAQPTDVDGDGLLDLVVKPWSSAAADDCSTLSQGRWLANPKRDAITTTSTADLTRSLSLLAYSTWLSWDAARSVSLPQVSDLGITLDESFNTWAHPQALADLMTLTEINGDGLADIIVVAPQDHSDPFTDFTGYRANYLGRGDGVFERTTGPSGAAIEYDDVNGHFVADPILMVDANGDGVREEASSADVDGRFADGDFNGDGTIDVLRLMFNETLDYPASYRALVGYISHGEPTTADGRITSVFDADGGSTTYAYGHVAAPSGAIEVVTQRSSKGQAVHYSYAEPLWGQPNAQELSPNRFLGFGRAERTWPDGSFERFEYYTEKAMVGQLKASARFVNGHVREASVFLHGGLSPNGWAVDSSGAFNPLVRRCEFTQGMNLTTSFESLVARCADYAGLHTAHTLPYAGEIADLTVDSLALQTTPSLDTQDLQWRAPAEVRLPAQRPDIRLLPASDPDASAMRVVDYDYDYATRSLDVERDFGDTDFVSDDATTSYQWNTPDTRGSWQVLLSSSRTLDMDGALLGYVHRSNFDSAAWDLPRNETRCAVTRTAASDCENYRYTYVQTGSSKGLLESITLEDTGANESIRYGSCGGPTLRTDAASRGRAYEYDSVCRLRREVFERAETVWSYDGFGAVSRQSVDPSLDETTSPLMVSRWFTDTSRPLTTDFNFAEPAWAMWRGDPSLEGALVLGFTDEHGRSTMTQVCRGAPTGASRKLEVLAQIRCTTPAMVTSWSGYQRDGRLGAQSEGYALGTTTPPNVRRYTYDELGATRAIQSAAHVESYAGANENERWITRYFTQGPRTVRELDASGRVFTSELRELSDEGVLRIALEHRMAPTASAPSVVRSTTILDVENRPVATMQPLSPTRRMTYDGQGRLTSMGYGNVTERCLADTTEVESDCFFTVTLSYDESARQVTRTLPDGSQQRQTFDTMGRPTETTLVTAAGASTRLQSVTYTKASPPSGPLVQTLDEATNEVVQTYDGLGRLRSQATALLPTQTWTYDAEGNLASHRDPQGRLQRYSYDASGRVTAKGVYDVATASRKISHSEIAYDAAGRVTYEIDPDRFVRATAYSFAGAPIETSTGTLDAVGVYQRGHILSASAYDDLGRVVWNIDSDGIHTRYRYDAYGRMVEESRGVDPSAPEAPGLLTHSATYDDADRVTGETLADATRQSRSELQYDDWGRLATTTNALGQSTVILRDVMGRVRKTTNAANESTITRYDPRGRVVHSKVPRQGITNIVYDANVAFDGMTKLFRTKSILTSLDGVVGEDGDPATTADLDYTTTQYNDGLGRVVAVRAPDSTGARYTYVGANLANVSRRSATWLALQQTNYEYDSEFGRLQYLRGPTEPARLVAPYTAVATHRYFYTTAGRQQKVIMPDDVTTYSYAADSGLLESELYDRDTVTHRLLREQAQGFAAVTAETWTGRGGAVRRTDVTRDRAGRLSVLRTTATGDARVQESRFENYNLWGAPTETRSLLDGATQARHVWTHSALGQPLSREQTVSGTTYTTQWRWRNNGELHYVQPPSGRKSVFHYDTSFPNRLSVVNDNERSPTARGATRYGSFVYDQRGLVIDATLAPQRGLVQTLSQTFDVTGRTTGRHTRSAGVTLTNWTGAYTQLGQLDYEQVVDARGTLLKDYTYRADGALLREDWSGGVTKTWRYNLDAAGNRLSTAVTNAGRTTTTPMTWRSGQLTRVGTATLTYDAWGAVTRDQNGYRFQYSPDGHLERTQNGARVLTFTRDASGIPVASSQGSDRRVVFYGLDTFASPLEVRDTARGIDYTYLQAAGLSLGRERTQSGSTTQSTLFVDTRQNVQMLGVEDAANTNAFGVGARALDSNSERFVFGGLETHPGFEKVLFARHRTYDPAAGRFNSADPIGLAGGSHRRLYAAADPVNGRDPSGLYTVLAPGDTEDPGVDPYDPGGIIDVPGGEGDDPMPSLHGLWGNIDTRASGLGFAGPTDLGFMDNPFDANDCPPFTLCANAGSDKGQNKDNAAAAKAGNENLTGAIPDYQAMEQGELRDLWENTRSTDPNYEAIDNALICVTLGVACNDRRPDDADPMPDALGVGAGEEAGSEALAAAQWTVWPTVNDGEFYAEDQSNGWFTFNGTFEAETGWSVDQVTNGSDPGLAPSFIQDLSYYATDDAVYPSSLISLPPQLEKAIGEKCHLLGCGLIQVASEQGLLSPHSMAGAVLGDVPVYKVGAALTRAGGTKVVQALGAAVNSAPRSARGALLAAHLRLSAATTDLAVVDTFGGGLQWTQQNMAGQTMEGLSMVGTVTIEESLAATRLARYYGGKAQLTGGWFFRESDLTYSASIDRANLALRPEWNTMEGVGIFNVPPGTPMVVGRGGSYGPGLPGGYPQILVMQRVEETWILGTTTPNP